MTMAGQSGPSNSNGHNGESNSIQERQFATLAVHAGAPHDPHTGAVIEPVGLDLAWSVPRLTTPDIPVYNIRPGKRWKASGLV